MRMPDLATVDATVTVVGWLVEAGQAVERGQPLLEVETDKAIVRVESPVTGRLREIAVAAGEEVSAGQVIARFVGVEKPDVELAERTIAPRSEGAPGDLARTATVEALGRGIAAGTAAIHSEKKRADDPLSTQHDRARSAGNQVTSPSPEVAAYSRDFLIRLYERMVLIREFEEGVKFLFLEGAMPGTIHQCQGQEATAVGVCAALEPGDFITSTFRGHGHALAKGLSTEELLFELFGAESPAAAAARGARCTSATWTRGWCRASRSSAEAFRWPRAWRWRSRCRRADEVVACFFGDGAVAEGAFHEGVNLAAIWDLPVHLRLRKQPVRRVDARRPRDAERPDRRSGGRLRHQRANAVDGNDVLAVYEAARTAAAECRAGRGPVLLELLTYRRTGHSRRDGCHYQPKEETRGLVRPRPDRPAGPIA